MSRHRLVRNMNIAEELDDEAISDGGDDELSAEDHERLQNGLEQIRVMVGTEAQSGISDQNIKDTLWHYYYDMQQSVDYLLEEQSRRQAAQQRRVDKPLPAIPGEDIEATNSPHRLANPHSALLNDHGSQIIMLGENDPEEFYYQEEDMQDFYGGNRVLKSPSLTTISEKSERTENSNDWPRIAERSVGGRSLSRTSWSSTTDFGQIIERPLYVDPNAIPPSPSSSALQRLSIPEPPPSASSTGSRTPTAQTIQLPEDEVIQYRPTATSHAGSAASDRFAARQGTAVNLEGSQTGPRSKSSNIASSRSSTASQSSGTYTVDSGSVKTYPQLRPSSQSAIILKSDAASDVRSAATSDSSIDMYVAKAIEIATRMEEMDAERSAARSRALVDTVTPRLIEDPPRPSAPIPEGTSTDPGVPHRTSPASSETRRKPTSKLAQLAQSKAHRSDAASSQANAQQPTTSEGTVISNPPRSSKLGSLAKSRALQSVSGASMPVRSEVALAHGAASTSSDNAKPTSKLAQRAQAKARQRTPTSAPADTPWLEASVSQASTSPEPKPASKLSQLVQSRAQQTSVSSAEAVQRAADASGSSQSAKLPSKLVQLAQAKIQQSTQPFDTARAANVDTAPASQPPKPTSKLAQLAQVKTTQSQHWMPPPKRTSAPPLPGLLVHQSHTEYLTPIANGATATTAITTTYQSLGDLAHPQRTRSATESMHIFASKPKSSERKESKLAMKSRKAREQPELEPEPKPVIITLDPIFAPTPSRRHVSPSAFASILVNEALAAEDAQSVKSSEKRNESQTSGQGSGRHQNKQIRAGAALAPKTSTSTQGFAFDVPSPDDIVFNARRGTSLAKPVKEQEKAQKLAQQKKAAETNARLPSASKKAGDVGAKKNVLSTPTVRANTAEQIDLAGLNLNSPEGTRTSPVEEPPPKVTVAREKVLEEAKKLLEGKDEKKGLSMVVIGHVDAGKSTLMGRLLYELGKMDERKRIANERASGKIGKSSFSWAWEFDGTTEERERGITMDIALNTMSTPHRQITILDAPGHKDFIPNMISGAAQADSALLVVDAATGEFEAGFERGGQTREHIILVRSLGVTQVIIAVNKLDMVKWDKDRYDDICSQLRPYLVQSGFQPSKMKFVPVGAMAGVNLVHRGSLEASSLNAWYSGPTLVDLLDQLKPPARDITAPLRFPIANVFKGQSSGIAVSGRVCSGLVQVGERLRVLPGDETAIVRSIESEEESLNWAAAGFNVTLYLTSIDPVNLNIGSVLCPLNDVIPLATAFTARIIVFDIQVPITAGTSVELFHHSRDVPASISRLVATIDRTSGIVIKKNPRVLTKSVSAEVQIVLRSPTYATSSSRISPIPLEPFSVNKEMGRVLIRRSGETIAAGIVLTVTANGTDDGA